MPENIDEKAAIPQAPSLDPMEILQSKGIDPGNKRVVDLSIPLEALPAWVIWLSVGLVVVGILPYILIYGFENLDGMFSLGIIPLFLGGIILHELCHAIGWKFASGLPWSAFSFGIMWRTASPYCHAKQPMLLTPYRIGAVLPLIITAILPIIIALFIASPLLTFASAVMLSAAVGDIYILWTLRDVPENALVVDHPSQAGCILLLD